ncbi:transposase [Escherichia coli]|nr:transposase [Escherichia coli]
MTKNTRFSPEVRQRAIRMVLESQGEYDSQWAAICSIAPKIGCTPETLKWSTKTGHRVRVFSSIDFPIRLVVTHHYIRAVLVRCNIQRYSPLLRELHR